MSKFHFLYQINVCKKKKPAIFYQSIFITTEFTLYFPVFWSFLCNYRQFRAILILRQVIINKVKMDLQSI